MSNQVLHTLSTERQAFKRANTGGEGEEKGKLWREGEMKGD